MTEPEASDQPSDQDMHRIVGEERKVLGGVLKHLASRVRPRWKPVDYDSDLIALRDEISEARLEDVPALVAEMERLQAVASRRAEVTDGDVDVESPYFGRIVLREGERKRQVLIGRSTYLDSRTGVQIVDWRDAPVSRIYYRYEEGDEYDEVFGDRLVEGKVLTRRSLAISTGQLRRVGSIHGTFLRTGQEGKDDWVRMGESATRLEGGQGTAPRPSQYKPVGKLGVSLAGDLREDKHLPEIAALIDPRQFDLITKPESGLVVIQGGAGSGKTTIGLHRMAYLAYQLPKRFRADRMLVVVFNDALARYISHVLPALGVPGAPVTTLHRWLKKLRSQHLSDLPRLYTDETPGVVARMKKHPAWLKIIDERMDHEADRFVKQLAALEEGAAEALAAFGQSRGQVLSRRLVGLREWVGSRGDELGMGARHGIERELSTMISQLDVVDLWSDLLTDKEGLMSAFECHAPGDFTEGQIEVVFQWCTARCDEVLGEAEDRAERKALGKDGVDDAVLEHEIGIDGMEERQPAALDWEDDALLLRIWQRLHGPLGKGRDGLCYEHVFVDEAQDLSPLELAVVLDTVNSESVTLAGDVAQRVMMDNGFSNWSEVLDILGLSHVAVEPLKISYRSTHEIISFGHQVLGPLLPEDPGQATRHGMPVELFRFSHTGDAVGFLSEALRTLVLAEPLASVAVITRTPEQAREYAEGLANAEVPNTRLIAEQDFPFKAGVDVTDVRQVKGLEFDYVVLVEVTHQSYPDKEEARHLLHIAATRAAHQLWVLTTTNPSPLLPQDLRDRWY